MKKLLISVLLILLTACVPLENEVTPTVIDSAITEVVKSPQKGTETKIPMPTKRIPATATSTVTPSSIPSPALPLHITSMNMQVFPDGGGWLSASFSTSIFIPGRTGLWHTTDGGTSWTNVLPPEFSEGGFASVFLDSQHAWIYGETFFQRTTNGGETWESLDPENIASGLFYRDLHFEDANHGWLVLSETSTGSTDIMVKTTEDGGKTWTFADLKPPHPAGQPWEGVIQITNLCDDRFYFSSQRQIIIHGTTSSCGQIYSDNDGDFPDKFGMDITTNLGQTWTRVSIPWTTDISKYKEKYKGRYPNIGILPGTLVFFNENDGILAVQVYDLDKQYTKTPDKKILIYHTSDGGMHWVPNNVELQDASPDLQALSAQIFIVPCVKEFCITRDSAHTWKKIPFGHFGNGYLDDFSFVNPMIGLVSVIDWFPGTDEYQFLLWKTTDGGASWIQVPISPPNS